MDISSIIGEALLETAIGKSVEEIYNLYKKNRFQADFFKEASKIFNLGRICKI